MEILGIFPDIVTAGLAVEGLIEEGFTEAQVTSLSSIPYPEGVLVCTKKRSWFHWLAPLGGIAGACAGFLLAAGTAWVYPVQTGDKPIIALYPTGIVTYEFTMLFAMIGTFAGMLLEMRLPCWRKRLYDPEIAEGYIGISVTIYPGGASVQCETGVKLDECIGAVSSLPAKEQFERAEDIMRVTGALRVIGEDTL